MRRLLIAALLPLALAAAPPVTRQTRVRIPAWLNGNGGNGAKLGLRNVAAMLDGSPARVVSLRGPGDDLLLILVLDLVGDLALVDPAKEALAAQIERLPDRTYTGLLRAQDGLKVITDPTRDRSSVAQAVRELPVSGKAGLLETVETALGIADAVLARSLVRVAVFYVTDSDVYNYREDYTNPVINSSDYHDLSRRFPEGLIQEKITKLEARVRAHQAPLFIVHLNYRSDRLNEAYQNGLKQLAEATGGSSAFCRSLPDIPASITAMFESIGAHYSIGIELPARVRQAVDVQLSLAGVEGRALNHRARLHLK